MKFSKQPLLRNLIAFQLLAIAAGLLCIGLAVYYTSQASYNQEVRERRQKIQARIDDRQEQWITWKQFHLEDALKEDIDSFSSQFRIKKVEIIPARQLPKVIRADQVISSMEHGDRTPSDQVVLVELDTSDIQAAYKTSNFSLMVLGTTACFFALIVILSGLYIRRRIHVPILELNQSFDKFRNGKDFSVKSIEARGEIKEFIDSVDEMYKQIQASEKQGAVVEVANQLAHDIKSPLAALNMTIGALKSIPEEQRLIINSSTATINDITNNLLGRSRKFNDVPSQNRNKDTLNSDESKSIQLLPTLVEMVISEKRMQFKTNLNVSIESEVMNSDYNLFSSVQPTEFKRVLSNLINNAVEAITSSGKVRVILGKSDGSITLTVQDNGKGIEQSLIPKLMHPGVTFGKENGNGLGLYHAKKSVETWNGTLLLSSELNSGTTVTVRLPCIAAPSWFASEITIRPKTKVIVLDDDTSIHHIFRTRFAALNETSNTEIEIVNFTTAQDMMEWYWTNQKSLDQATFLCDYELIGSEFTGLDVIADLGISSQSFLVTSRFEEPSVRERCQQLGVKLVPKVLAGYVTIGLKASHARADAVLVDDDTLVHLSWKLSAKAHGKSLLCFENHEEFLSEMRSINEDAELFIDVFLKNGVRGENIAERAHEAGFETIYLSTGAHPDQVRPAHWIKRVIGKEPPWVAKPEASLI